MKTWRLVSGIISIVLSCFVLFQSCAAGFVNSVENNGQVSGTVGAFVALLMMSGGVLAIATRQNIGKGNSIALAVLYGLGALFGFTMAGNFSDLLVWAFWCFVCCVLAIGAYALSRVDAMPEDEQPDQAPGEKATHRDGGGKKRSAIRSVLKWVLIVFGGLFILLLVIGALSDNGEDSTPADAPQEQAQPQRAEEKPAYQKIQLYDSAELEVAFVSVDADGVNFEITNKTSRTLDVWISPLALDGQSYDTIWSTSIAPRSTGTLQELISEAHSIDVSKISGEIYYSFGDGTHQSVTIPPTRIK